ncbi:MAG: PaaI family thioesterase [Proteobacteria bacterium]|nr:PaaI family thioesterase [Pseudomonadota bacterium]
MQRFFAFDPGEDPSWKARRRLGEAGRELAERCVDATPDADAINKAAELVEQAVALLGVGPTPAEVFADGRFHADPARYLDRSAMFGDSNPLAPPMHLRWENERSVCDMAFGWRHGGAPGIVHGGLIAAALDQVSGHCATLAGRSGLTVQLDVTYRKAVPVGTPLRLEAWVETAEKRRTFVHATCTSGKVVYATSIGIFVVMDRSKMRNVLNGDESSSS